MYWHIFVGEINMNSKDRLKELDEMTRQSQTKGLPSFFYVLPILHLLIALPFAYYLNIWADEGSTLYTTQNGFFQAFQNTLGDEKQAPLYFLILSLWREINDSIFFARLFSIICSLGSVFLFYDLVRRIWNDKTAIFAGFFFAIHPYLIFASTEIRVYSLMIFLTLLLTKLFFRGYLERRRAKDLYKQKLVTKRQIWFILVAIFSLYTNYYLGFVLVAFFAVLLVLKRRRVSMIYFGQMAFVGLMFLPMLWVIKSQFAVNTGGHFQATNWIEGLKELWNHLITFILPTELYPPEEQTFISFLRVWIIRILGVAVVVLLIIKRKIFDQKILIFGTMSAVILAFMYFAYFMLSEIYIEIRHAACLFAFICFLIVAVINAVLPEGEKGNENPKNFYILGALAVLLIVFYSYGISAIYPEFVKRGDWERVGTYIEKNEKQNQPIIIFSNYQALNLPYHYEGKNKILPNENFFKWNYEAEFGSPKSFENQIEYTISIIPKDAEEIWLLTESVCQETQACLPLEKFIKENYTIIEIKDFYKERVLLLRKK